MKSKLLVTGLVAVALLATSVSPASAHGWDRGGGHWGGGRGHDGLLLGIGAGVAAVVGAAAYIATAPVRIIADAADGPAPVYAAPQPVYYQAAPAYYQPQRVVYAAPPAYYGYAQ